MNVPERHGTPPLIGPLRLPLWHPDAHMVDAAGPGTSMLATPDTPGFAVSRYIEPLLEASLDCRPPVIDLCGWEGALALGLHEWRPELGGVCANFTIPALRAAIHNLAGTNWTVVPGFGAPTGQSGAYNTAFLRVPYWLGSSAVRALIRTAFRVLRPGGELLLAGERRRGSETYRRFAKLHFQNVDTILAKRHTRVFRSVKGDDVPEEQAEESATVQVVAADFTVTLAWNPAVYSDGKLDPGTAAAAVLLSLVANDAE